MICNFRFFGYSYYGSILKCFSQDFGGDNIYEMGLNRINHQLITKRVKTNITSKTNTHQNDDIPKMTKKIAKKTKNNTISRQTRRQKYTERNK